MKIPSRKIYENSPWRLAVFHQLQAAHIALKLITKIDPKNGTVTNIKSIDSYWLISVVIGLWLLAVFPILWRVLVINVHKVQEFPVGMNPFTTESLRGVTESECDEPLSQSTVTSQMWSRVIAILCSRWQIGCKRD